MLEVLPQLHEAQDRSGHARRDHIERDELTHRQRAVDHEPRAEPQDPEDHQLVRQTRDLGRHVRQVRGPETRADVGREAFLEAPLRGRLDRAGLQRFDTADGFDEVGLVVGPAIELLVQTVTQHRGHEQRERDVARQRGHDNKRQHRAVGEQHGEEHERERDINNERERGTGDEIAQGFEFAHPRDDIAHPARLEIRERQAQQMAEQLRAKRDVDPVRRVREHVRAQPAEHGIEQRHDEQPEREQIERGETAVHEHLVDDDLEEQRGDEREQLQKERREQHFRKIAPVLKNKRREPGEVELAPHAG